MGMMSRWLLGGHPMLMGEMETMPEAERLVGEIFGFRVRVYVALDEETLFLSNGRGAMMLGPMMNIPLELSIVVPAAHMATAEQKIDEVRDAFAENFPEMEVGFVLMDEESDDG